MGIWVCVSTASAGRWERESSAEMRKKMVKAVVGANWGDEGKGKITDMMAQEADIIVRFQGGANAGHTIVNNYGKFALHTLLRLRNSIGSHIRNQYYYFFNRILINTLLPSSSIFSACFRILGSSEVSQASNNS